MKSFPFTIKTLLVLTLVSVVFFSCKKTPVGGTPGGSSTITGIAKDAVTFDNLTGAIVTLTPAEGGTKSAVTATVDNDGKYEFANLAVGIYNLSISFAGYKNMGAKNLNLNDGNPFIALLPVDSSITSAVGGLTGVVLDNNNNPLANASIALSAQDESLTNGYFMTAQTNQFGQFFIGAVPVGITNEFKVRCMAANFDVKVTPNVMIQENEMSLVYFKLSPATPANLIWSEDFEGDMDGWSMTGFWHVQPNAVITNNAYPMYVKLAPNDGSEAKIPTAYKGSKSMWYGEAATGNFMGTPSTYQSELSGGTSTSSNQGRITSPVISLAGQSVASLNFQSWFEIESVNPNQYGFDLMEVIVVEEGSTFEVLLGRLNPYTDPILSDRAALPFTSGGFNQAPLWKYEEFDLSAYVGKNIRLIFQFKTVDHLYNGFRGWFVDDIKIVDKAASETAKRTPINPNIKSERK